MNYLAYNDPEGEFFLRAVRKVARLPEVDGPISNEVALGILFAHYVIGASKSAIVEGVLGKDVPKSKARYIEKILAKNEGKDTSRRPDIRRIFVEYLQSTGRPVPFESRGEDKAERKDSKGSGGAHKPRWRTAKPLLESTGGFGLFKALDTAKTSGGETKTEGNVGADGEAV